MTPTSATEWESGLHAITLDRENGIPLHLQLRDALRQAIRSAPSSVEKVPSETILMRTLGISQATVRTALERLVREGLIRRQRGIGTLLVRNVPARNVFSDNALAPRPPPVRQTGTMNPLYQRSRPSCLDIRWEPGAGLIWMQGETLFFENPRNRTLRFRKTFHLPFDPVSAELRVFADTHYQLFLNGAPCARGPGRSDPTWTYYDHLDVAPRLHRGDNDIALLVLFQGFGTGSRISIMQGLLFHLVIRGADGEHLAIVSDRSWKAAPAEEFLRPTPRLHGPLGCIEVQDTQLIPDGWLRPGYDDSGWAATDYVKSGLTVTPWYHFVPSPLPLRSESDVETLPRARLASAHGPAPAPDALGQPRPVPVPVPGDGAVFPVRLPATAPDTAHVVTLDLARIENGLLRLEIDGPAGAVVDALFADSIAPGDVIPKPEQARILTGRWILRGDRQTLEVAFNWLAFRHVQLWVWSPGPVTVHRAWLRTLYYPLPVGQVEGFRCSDDSLTRLDAICAHTVRLCYQDGIVDSPSREQQQWIGDARRTAIFNHHRWGDAALHRNLIEQIGQGMDWMGSMVPRYPSGNRNVSPIPSYCLDWIGAFEEFYQFTGDDSLLAHWWPNLLLAIRWFSAFERPDDGLLARVPHWIYIDMGRDAAGRGMGSGEVLATLNLQYLSALRAIAGYANRLGDQASHAWFASRAERLASSLREQFWNETEHGYADAMTDGVLTEGVSEVTAAHALLFLESPGSPRAAQIIKRVLARGGSDPATVVRASPFSIHTVLQALRLHGREQDALDLIRQRYRPLLDAGATATWEHWELSEHGRTDASSYPRHASACHAWGAAPMAFFTGVVLGIRPQSPGWKQVEIRPFCGDLEDASGACLTPQGLLEVRWHVRSATFTLHIKAPSGIEGTVLMPDGSRHPLRTGLFTCESAPAKHREPTGKPR